MPVQLSKCHCCNGDSVNSAKPSKASNQRLYSNGHEKQGKAERSCDRLLMLCNSPWTRNGAPAGGRGMQEDSSSCGSGRAGMKRGTDWVGIWAVVVAQGAYVRLVVGMDGMGEMGSGNERIVSDASFFFCFFSRRLGLDGGDACFLALTACEWCVCRNSTLCQPLRCMRTMRVPFIHRSVARDHQS